MNTPFFLHMLEIRYRVAYVILSLFITFFFGTFYSISLTHLICIPFSPGRTEHSLFIFTHVTEGLYAAIEVSFVCTFFLCLPLIFYQLYSFFIPSCYQGERILINLYFISLIALFLISVSMAYSVVLPKICTFLRQFQYESKCMEIRLEARIAPAVRWSCTAFFITAILFQIPLFFPFLCRLPPSFLRKNRKYAFFIILLITSILSPPDVPTQCIFALIGYTFYESLLWCAFYYQNWNSDYLLYLR